ncbi:putative tartrate dehydrogenase/decarboxylase TtuC' [Dickeya solani]|nr:putative tartrate dehydrogenase/decarboxylase TtuC' [Dickeya solani]
MMLEHLGHDAAGAAVLSAIERVLEQGPGNAPLTRDLGGSGNTAALGEAIMQALSR